MSGLSTDIVVHRLPIKEDCKPVQQKLRRMRPDVVLKIKEEVQKQFDAGFLQVVKYSKWVANIVLVSKKDGKELEIYVDDMIAKSKTKEEHVLVLKKLFMRLRKFQLKLNPAKCTFGVRSGKLLGFVVSERGIEIDPDKVRVIQELPPPRTQKEVRGFLGRLNYIARADATLPRQTANTDLAIFENSMGCVLGKHDETGRKERAIYNLSKKFTECETRYSPIEKLCCALIWTTRRLRQYMLYHTTWLISKLDPLKYLMESTALNGRMARWQILLSEFDIVYVNQKAAKGSAIADFLASRALEDYEPLNFDFPNEDLMYVATIEKYFQEGGPWKLNFDGASNAIACIMGIRAAIERKIKVLKIYGDSALVIYQLKGEWETRDPKLVCYRKLVMELIEEFDSVTFSYRPRDENQMADALATLASMFRVNRLEDMKPIQISIYEAPAHCCNIDNEGEKDDHPWNHDILRYVKSREYPDHATENDKKTLRRLAIDYVLDGDILYKRGKDQVLLRCVDTVEAKEILEEVHEGICGTHANG
ncbi:uncharacterized protein LOC105797411 [Gossypium raimondii]|uniref:uncharacterized protein LOC105797411 n=1 Tax=Gossypium raimondii TaxID=29730 RepID=UPI00227C87B1|nr:uncharacterized protein LOC105797411 [Gossypium raimondii]